MDKTDTKEKEEKLKEIFARVLSTDRSKINGDLSKENTSEWDSFNHLMLISEVEKEFSINVPMSELEKINTFSDVLKIVS